MNDEHAGQLTVDWDIPAYAQGKLWIAGEAGSSPCEGESGLFELPTPEPVLSLRWNSDEGAVLRQFRWQPDALGWRGEFRMGGMVEAIHMMQLPGADFPLVVVLFSGQPLLPDVTPFPDLSKPYYEPPDWYEGIDDAIDPALVTLIAPEESSLASVAQDAMMNKMPLHVYGQLASEEQGFQHILALPLLWESVTMFAP
ncbi:MAG: hypothetical protein KC496_03750 [Anaerolineae bacterium]|nr:hypothetical protein [Anaerolineae bacterium]